MKTLPYFRWYPADAVGDEFYSHLTCIELGVYHRCLDHSWMNDGIPADTAALAIICHMNRKPFEKVWEKLHQRWSTSPRDPSRLINPRQERERDYAIRVGENNKRAGNANALKSRTDGDKNALYAGARRASDSDSDSDSQEKPTEKNTASTRVRTEFPPSLSQSEFPLIIAEIRKHDAAVDEPFVRALVNKTVQYCISHPKFPADMQAHLNDKNIARCCAESYKTGPKTHGTGLLLSRVPPIALTWSLED